MAAMKRDAIKAALGRTETFSSGSLRPVTAVVRQRKRTLANLAAGARGVDELWRSRFDAERNLVVINHGHRDFVYTNPARTIQFALSTRGDTYAPTAAHFNLRSLGL